jgi:hypothetical protein
VPQIACEIAGAVKDILDNMRGGTKEDFMPLLKEYAKRERGRTMHADRGPFVQSVETLCNSRRGTDNFFHKYNERCM